MALLGLSYDGGGDLRKLGFNNATITWYAAFATPYVPWWKVWHLELIEYPSFPVAPDFGIFVFNMFLREKGGSL